MPTPDALTSAAEAAAFQWRADLALLDATRQQVVALERERAQLREDLAAAGAREDGLRAELAVSAAQSAELDGKLTLALARLAELEALLGQCGDDPDPLPDVFQDVELVVFGDVTPVPGTMVSVGAVLPEGLGASVAAAYAESGERLATANPQQLDVVTRWPDGSAKHVLLSVPYWAGEAYRLFPARTAELPAMAPQLPVDLAVELSILRADGSRENRAVIAPSSPAEYAVRFSGPVMWEGRTGLEVDPLLRVLFDVRCYATGEWNATVILENVRHDQSATITYDVAVTAGGREHYRRAAVAHHHHARYPIEVDPWGALGVCSAVPVEPWIKMALLPPYADVKPSANAIADMVADYRRLDSPDPMSSGMVNRAMGAPGGRGDIGLLPTWTVRALLSGDPGAYAVMIGCGRRSGAFPVHYRDETGLPYSIRRHPTGSIVNYKSQASADAIAIPASGPGIPAAPLKPDHAHQPDLCSVPYLVTGSRYLMEELEFWPSWNGLSMNSSKGFRGGAEGLWKASTEARAQAWPIRAALRAYQCLPDSEAAVREEIAKQLEVNAAWYAANAVPSNELGQWGWNRYSIDKFAAWPEVGWHVRNWQIDFLTMAAGWCVRAGLEDWRPFAAWLARNVTGRIEVFATDPAGWSLATTYHLAGGDTAGKWFPSWEKVRAVSPPGESWHPEWTHHWQVQALAALTVAHELGHPKAAAQHDELASLTTAAFPERYRDDPTFYFRKR